MRCIHYRRRLSAFWKERLNAHSAANDSLINQTLTNSDVQAMYNWQDYLSTQLPMLWQPNADYQLNEIANNLKGVAPMSPTLSINPENWYFVK